MSDISSRARYLMERVLKPRFISNDQRLKMPQVSRGTVLPKENIQEAMEPLRIRIKDSTDSQASICLEKKIITLTSGWCCKRWSSAYALLKSISQVSEHVPVLWALAADDFVWP